MFERLAKHDVILVSGPQRAGTHVAAQMIAADTGHRYIDETGFCVFDEHEFSVILQQHKVVIQCPSMCHVLHTVGTDGILVVMMLRDLEDIRASELRVNWNIGVYAELANYGFGTNELAARRYRKHGGQIAPLKYAYWWGHQRELILHYLELDYESLSGHPLWVPKAQRAEFAARQTEK